MLDPFGQVGAKFLSTSRQNKKTLYQLNTIVGPYEQEKFECKTVISKFSCLVIAKSIGLGTRKNRFWEVLLDVYNLCFD